MAGATGPTFVQRSGKIPQSVSNPTTRRLLIIGTAVDGPINKPYQINNTAVAERLFGPANYSLGYLDPNDATESLKSNGATIPLAIAQAIAAGCGDIWVCRASGTYAQVPSAFSSKLDVRASYPGRIYNTAALTILPASGYLNITYTQPAKKGGTVTSQLSSGLTVSDMIQQINNNPLNKCFYIQPDTWPTYLASSAYTTISSAGGTATLTGGTNGCRAVGDDYGADTATGVNGLATLLTVTDSGTFDAVLGTNLRFDEVVLTSIYIDDQVVNTASATSTTIATDFITFLDQVSADISPCHGVIAVRPPNHRDDSSIISWVTNNLLATAYAAYNSTLRWNCAGPFLYYGWNRIDSLNGTVDLGVRLSVVAGPEAIYTHPDRNTYTDMWHVSYAALLTQIPPERSPLRMTLPGVSGFGTPIPRKYLDKLTNGVGYDSTNVSTETGQGAYVTLIRDSNNIYGPMRVYDDPTVSSRSDYCRQWQLINLVNSIQNDLDQRLQPFYGGSTNQQALAAMETAVQNILEGYNHSGAIKGGKGDGYNFTVQVQGNDGDLGAIHVSVEINPSRSLRKIYLIMSIRKP